MVPVRIIRLESRTGYWKGLWINEIKFLVALRLPKHIRQQLLWKVQVGDRENPEEWKNSLYCFDFCARKLGEST